MSSASPSAATSPTSYLLSLDPSLRPKLIVFDLDYTLWDFWIDTHLEPPFTLTRAATFSTGASTKQPPVLTATSLVHDSTGKSIELYPGVEALLHSLSHAGYHLAIASRTHAPESAKALLELVQLTSLFSHAEIYPGSKVKHFKQLVEECGELDSESGFHDVLFFDDETRNVRQVGALGVHVVHVPEGLSGDVLVQGVKQFVTRNHQDE